MLQTVLEIGKRLRKSKENYKYHKYIKQCPFDDKKRAILRLSVPVDKDFYFKIEESTEITNENIQKNNLFYLTFKTSDADTTTKYVFGDIYYKKDENGKEGGNYNKKGAFESAEDLIKNCANQTIPGFRAWFKKQKKDIEALLDYDTKKYGAIFINFYFESEECPYWYGTDAMEEIDTLLTGHFFKDKDNELVSDSMLYRTLCSGNKNNDIQFPDFNVKNRGKNFTFSQESAKDLFYGVNFTEKPLLSIKNTDIKIVVLPKGDNLKLEHYDSFFDFYGKATEDGKIENAVKREKRLKSENSPSDTLFPPALTDETELKNIVEFDLIFTRQGWRWSDIIELTGINKSDLREIDSRIKNIKNKLGRLLGDSRVNRLNIMDAFYEILGNGSYYQNHLCAVLPKIYTASYFSDPILLPELVKKTEYNIRSEAKFPFPKHEFYFLIYLQNTINEGERLMEIKESKSYNIGLLLGRLVKPLRDSINSFEKSYVGNLSTRIATIEDLVRFFNFVNEKLTIQEKLYNYIKDTSYQLSQEIKNFTEDKEKYNKNECVFGFFESYYNKKSEENNGKV